MTTHPPQTTQTELKFKVPLMIAAAKSLESPPQNSALNIAVAEAERSFADRNPKSAALHAAAMGPMPGGNTRTALHYSPFPLYVESSEGAMLTDVDGRPYLDVLGEFTAGLYGHRQPRLMETVQEIAGKGMSNGASGEMEIKLATAMCARFPHVEKLRFCNSGTEANLYAMTLARHHTGRTKFLCFSGAYHGGVLTFGGGAASAMNAPFDWTICEYNDIKGSGEAIRAMGSELAAVIVEPMMSNGGCIPASREFLQALRSACSETGAMLIFDEIVTSRMGASGLAAKLGLSADLTTFGKYLGGGFSFGAFGGKGDVMNHFDPSKANALPHAGTFNNNVFSMGVGVVGLEEVFTPERAEQLFNDGETLRERLNKLTESVEGRVQFTGCGSTMNIHFTGAPIQRPADLDAEVREFYTLFHLDLMEEGVYAARRGQINLSLPMTSADFDKIVEAVESFLARRRDLIVAHC